MSRRIVSAYKAIAVAVVLGFVAPVQAQPSARLGTSPWDAWIGCWDLIPRRNSAEQSSRVCVLPTANSSVVDVVTVVGDSLAGRQRLDATSQKREVAQDGCTGHESIHATGTRVYLRTTLSCNGVGRLTNSVMAISRDGEWLDIRGVAIGTNAGVRAARYRESASTAKLPSEVAAALRGRPRGTSAARIAAAGGIGINDVIEASRYLEVGVLQTWLAERGQGFGMDARQLVALEKAGVAPSVIDVMVALSYPQVFALDRTRLGDPPPNVAGEENVVFGGGDWYDDYGYGPYDYGYDRYGYGRGYGWYSGRQPVVIVRQADGEAKDPEHGKVVKGRGYVSGREGSGSGTERSGGESGGRASGSSGSSGGSSDKGTSTGRTAKPRPPG